MNSIPYPCIALGGSIVTIDLSVPHLPIGTNLVVVPRFQVPLEFDSWCSWYCQVLKFSRGTGCLIDLIAGGTHRGTPGKFHGIGIPPLDRNAVGGQQFPLCRRNPREVAKGFHLPINGIGLHPVVIGPLGYQSFIHVGSAAGLSDLLKSPSLLVERWIS